MGNKFNQAHINFYVDDSLHDKVLHFIGDNDINMSQFMRDAVIMKLMVEKYGLQSIIDEKKNELITGAL